MISHYGNITVDKVARTIATYTQDLADTCYASRSIYVPTLPLTSTQFSALMIVLRTPVSVRV